MGSERSKRLSWAIVVAALVVSGVSGAEPSPADKETARALMKEGDKKMSSGDAREALKAYKAADDIMGVPTTGIEVARAQIQLKMLVEARDTLQRVIRSPAAPKEPAPFAKARARAEELYKELEARVPSVRVVLEGLAAGARPEVTIDGEALPSTAVGFPRKVNPGTRRIVASAIGHESVSVELTLAEGDNRTATLQLKQIAQPPPPAASSAAAPPPPPTTPPPSATPPPISPPPPPPPPPAEASLRKPALVYGGFGLGLLGVAAGGVSGLLALSQTSTAKSQCDGVRCPEEARSSIVAAKNWAFVSNVSFAVGLVGAGVGLVALIASSGSSTASSRPPSIEPVVGLGNLGLRGQF